MSMKNFAFISWYGEREREVQCQHHGRGIRHDLVCIIGCVWGHWLLSVALVSIDGSIYDTLHHDTSTFMVVLLSHVSWLSIMDNNLIVFVQVFWAHPFYVCTLLWCLSDHKVWLFLVVRMRQTLDCQLKLCQHNYVILSELLLVSCWFPCNSFHGWLVLSLSPHFYVSLSPSFFLFYFAHASVSCFPLFLQIPKPLTQKRKRFLGIKWLITAARERPGDRRTLDMSQRLAAEIIDAYNHEVGYS